MPRNTAVKKSHAKIIAKKPAAKAKGTGRNGMKLPRNLRHSHIYQTSRKLKASEVPEGTLSSKIGDLKKEWISVADTNGNLAWRLKTDRLIEKLCSPPPKPKKVIESAPCEDDFCGTEEPSDVVPAPEQPAETVVVEPAHEVAVPIEAEAETEVVVAPQEQQQ